MMTDEKSPPAQQPGSSGEKRAGQDDSEEHTSKRVRVEETLAKEHEASNGANGANGANGKIADTRSEPRERTRGQAPIKAEYLVTVIKPQSGDARGQGDGPDDDAAEEGRALPTGRSSGDRNGAVRMGKKNKQKGANKDRQFGFSSDSIRLCNSRSISDESSPKECGFGDRCNLCHDLRKYLADGRRGDLQTFDGQCPVWEANGWCPAGWKCRFVKSHMKEVEREDGRKELILLRDDSRRPAPGPGTPVRDDDSFGVVNVVSGEDKQAMSRKKIDLSMSDKYIQWMEKHSTLIKKMHNARTDDKREAGESLDDLRAQFTEPPLLPSEKRRIYFGRETPVLAPLTTQGNLPFRRLCVELGAQATYSEMAMGLPILQGQKGEWALMKAHKSETASPRFSPSPDLPESVVKLYDNSRDLKFGAQISANAPWVATKAAQCLSTYVPHLRLIDLNCGCPIDMVYKAGAGSALLEQPSKIDRIVRGMNAVSGEVPITCKLRVGVKEGSPTALRNIERIAFGSPDFADSLGAPGCAAVTLHGRSRQQRYKRPADWSYIAECAALVRGYRDRRDELSDTAREADPRTLPPGGWMYFLGNGDCYSHEDYLRAVDASDVDTVMVGRGALIKPWLFEEIEKGQYLDKSSSERLGYVDKFCRYGMEAWGSDEMGIGLTRRFLLEYLSFAYRYVPVGLLEHLPPHINDRPPAYRGRDELETLMASDNYKDWIKISEMFLGPAHEGFKFQPKHKSNSYESLEAEG